MERLERKIQAIEQKLNPAPKGGFDIIKHIADIRTETERLMQLSQIDYNQEIEKPPHSKANQIARVGVADKKRFANLTPELQREELGYPTLALFPVAFAEIQEAQNRIRESPINWITTLLKETHIRDEIEAKLGRGEMT